MDNHGSYKSHLPTDSEQESAEKILHKVSHLSSGTLIDLGDAYHDVKHNEDSDIPAGYTYLGQFINHDVHSLLNAGSLPRGLFESDTYRNTTTPQLDLSSMYSLGGFDDHSDGELDKRTGKFRLNPIQSNEGSILQEQKFDLPRNPATKKAYIQDPRNDENLLLAQLHVQFLKLHNHIIEMDGTDNAKDNYRNARIKTTLIYKNIVVHDFLKRLLSNDIWTLYFESPSTAAKKLEIDEKLVIEARKNPIFFKNDVIPKEFSVAAFRFGHSMVRDTYKINNRMGQRVTLHDLFNYTGKRKLNGHEFLPRQLVVDWLQFFPGTSNERHSPQDAHAFRPATHIEIPHLEWPEKRLAIRNLLRSQSLGLPTAQTVASRIDKAKKLPKRIIQFIKDNRKEGEQLDFEVHFKNSTSSRNPVFFLSKIAAKAKLLEHTPLWFYLLVESKKYKKEGTTSKNKVSKLGPTSSLIIAETFYNLIFSDTRKSEDLARTNITTMKQLIDITQPKGEFDD